MQFIHGGCQMPFHVLFKHVEISHDTLPRVWYVKIYIHVPCLGEGGWSSKYSMPVRHVPVYVDEEDSNVYSVFVTSTGFSDLFLPCDGCRSYRLYKSAMDMGYCVATNEQVNALDIYISQYKLRDLDIMAYPDDTRRLLPPAMRGIWQNGHAYDVGVVMVDPDFARFYIRQSGGGTVRLVYLSKKHLSRPRTFRHT